MREIILKNLSDKIDKSVVESLLDTFNKLVTAYRKGDLGSGPIKYLADQMMG
jgi:hypothetical protein